jgi:hypothetical protein
VQNMRDAFESQEVSRLQQIAMEMDETEFKYHLDRYYIYCCYLLLINYSCVKSGLWLPQGNRKEGDENDGEQKVDDEEFETPRDGLKFSF